MTLPQFTHGETTCPKCKSTMTPRVFHVEASSEITERMNRLCTVCEFIWPEQLPEQPADAEVKPTIQEQSCTYCEWPGRASSAEAERKILRIKEHAAREALQESQEIRARNVDEREAAVCRKAAAEAECRNWERKFHGRVRELTDKLEKQCSGCTANKRAELVPELVNALDLALTGLRRAGKPGEKHFQGMCRHAAEDALAKAKETP